MTQPSSAHPAETSAAAAPAVAEDDATRAELTPELMQLGRLLLEGLDRVDALGACIETLDELMLTGRPPAIADAAMVVELSLSSAAPLFVEICHTLDSLGTPRLQDAADRLRQADQPAVAATAESLNTSLKRFAKRNAAYHRRAQSLSRGLTASLRSLHALGLAGNGRLLAEA